MLLSTLEGPQEVWGSGGCSPLRGRAAPSRHKPALQPGWHFNALQKLLLLEKFLVIAVTSSPRRVVNHGAGQIL